MRKEWLYATLALIAGLAGGFLGSKLNGASAAVAAEAKPKNLAAESIRLVDVSGKTHAALHLNKDGEPSFEIYDHTGKLRAGLAIDSEQELALRLYDVKGSARVGMSVSPDGVPALRLFDAEARPRTLLGVDHDGEPALDFYASNGKLMRELP
jgi:hypothetical protein